MAVICLDAEIIPRIGAAAIFPPFAGNAFRPLITGNLVLRLAPSEADWRAFRHFGHDIADEDTPIEAGLGFTIAWDKPGGFVGREALLKQKEANIRPKRMIALALEDDSEAAPLMYHEEPIYRDGALVGSTTSGVWGHRVEKSLALGYVNNPEGVTKDWLDAGNWEVEIAWQRHLAKVQFQSFYDPKSERIKV